MSNETIPTAKPSAPEKNKPQDGQFMPPVSDTGLTVTGAPDADYHPVALANAVVDSEAGATPDDEQGRIIPLKRKE